MFLSRLNKLLYLFELQLLLHIFKTNIQRKMERDFRKLEQKSKAKFLERKEMNHSLLFCGLAQAQCIVGMQGTLAN